MLSGTSNLLRRPLHFHCGQVCREVVVNVYNGVTSLQPLINSGAAPGNHPCLSWLRMTCPSRSSLSARFHFSAGKQVLTCVEESSVLSFELCRNFERLLKPHMHILSSFKSQWPPKTASRVCRCRLINYRNERHAYGKIGVVL
jgi:hypothetical protein